MATAEGAFQIEMVPGRSELEGRASRFTFTKTWTGEIEGTSSGVMISGGDPASGSAGYVALEAFDGMVGARSGGFLYQQFGRMTEGTQELLYQVVPGSGTGELAGVSGTLAMTIVDGEHRVRLTYEIT